MATAAATGSAASAIAANVAGGAAETSYCHWRALPSFRPLSLYFSFD